MSALRPLALSLSVLLGACTEDVSPTVLRFFVYSDVEFARVRATVGGQPEQLDGGLLKDFFPDAGTSGNNLLFSIAVERTERSTDQQGAELSFEGFAGSSADSQAVLRQTVRADFTERDTRVVRIWLSRACVHENGLLCQEGMSCDGNTGGCVATPGLTTADFNATEDMSRWQPTDNYRACGARDGTGNSDSECPIYCSPSNDSDCEPRALGQLCTNDDQCGLGSCECAGGQCAELRCAARKCAADLANDPMSCGSCGVQCEYPRCSQGMCSKTTLIPPVGTEPFTEQTDFVGVYMRRTLGEYANIAAIGVNSPQVGAKYRVFVASDVAGEPGVVLASGEVTVEQPATLSDAGRARGTEYTFPQTVEVNGPAWIGFGALGLSTIDTSRIPTLILERRASKVPADGQSFDPAEVVEPAQVLVDRPSFYAVQYPQR